MSVEDAAKLDAAERAAALVRSGMVVGLGTGSTAALVVESLGRRLREGILEGVVGIPTSRRTAELARSAGIDLTTLEERAAVDLTIDGADQVDADGNMIKGGGGALLWEKIVAAASDRYVIVVDRSKLVARLGIGFPLPVEVVTFGWRTHVEALRLMGSEAALRLGPDGAPFRTDEQHYILDCPFPDGIDDAPGLDAALAARPGVVTTGLFVGFSPEVIVGEAGSGS